MSDDAKQPPSRKGRGAYHLSTPAASSSSSSSVEAVAAHDYRDQFLNHGRSKLYATDSYDLRRTLSWAPYVVVPAVAIATRLFVPKKYHVRAWVGTLLGYGFVSVCMYSSDTSE